MSIDFQHSETRENLMRAFAGESQARNRYTFAAEEAKLQKLPVLERLFTFTANQEKEHAEIFYNHLKPLAGTTIQIDGGYPIDLYPTMEEILKAAQHNEYEENDPIYKAFGDKAAEEGFPSIASSFYGIAAIEKIHGDRFGTFAKLMEDKKLFSSDTQEAWICLNCGHIHMGPMAPAVCPICHKEQGYFVRLSMMPVTLQSL
ncbi:rubrerythrin family protein [Candidatus Merdisoma sp. JLR.KK011]|uniref:rubrerythrin family protein n=1 Tax=Candidatus Merdisoma sp. JLR.KK011 TaxID=3114299 RepID=UPI002FF1803B